MNPRAILFDVDGTLTDTNYLHVDAWARAFAAAGVPTDAWRIHRAIGLDSDLLLEHLHPGLGEDVAARAKELHSDFYKELWPRVRALSGARELIRALSDAGMKVVLATSAPEEEFEVLRECLGVDESLFAFTTSDDVETAKPEPDIVQVALRRGEVDADQAIMVGDSVWDGEAARKAGVRFVAMLSGGIGSSELSSADAVEIYEDPSDLLGKLERSIVLGQEVRSP